jgi:uncharacterized membrane protein
MTEYARWYKPVIILNGLVFLVAFTALISGGENGKIIGMYGGLIGAMLFGIWFWHMKSIQVKSLQGDIKHSTRQEEQKRYAKEQRRHEEDSQRRYEEEQREQRRHEEEQRQEDRNDKPNSTLRTFYDILEVNETATSSEIKKAYREWIKFYHPDKFESKSPEDKERAMAKAKKITEAYEKLKKSGKID